MKLSILTLSPDERRLYIEQAAIRRNGEQDWGHTGIFCEKRCEKSPIAQAPKAARASCFAAMKGPESRSKKDAAH